MPWHDRLVQIQLLILDVDGVLTDGTLHYSAEGEATKLFNVKDGLGIRLCQHHGIDVAIITARDSAPLARRVRDLGISHFFPASGDKLAVFKQLLTTLNLSPEHVAYAGDDMLDLPVMEKSGLSISVADGYSLVQERADWVTKAAGGKGAVREICDALVAARLPLEQAYAELLTSDTERHRLTKA